MTPAPGLVPERKYVTILFVDLQQSTSLVADLDPEEALSLLDPALQVMRDAVRRHGGIVSKELGDGIKALFGAPVADARHAAMACHAALDIVGGIAGLRDPRLQVRCGIHSHYVVTQITQGDYSSVYDATGPAAHLANRLQAAAAPGQVFVSDTCRAMCEGMFSFEALPPVALKGFPGPIAMHRVIGPRAQSLWQARAAVSIAPFSGRAHEIAVLQACAEDVLAGRFRCAAVVGDPGFGKSRLMHEFLAGLDGDRWTVALTAGHPALGGRPYAAVADLLERLEADSADPEADAAAEPDGDLRRHWASALATIRDRPVADSGWRQLEPSQRLRLVRRLFLRLIAVAAAGRALAIVFDDAQWIDRQSMEVLRGIEAPGPCRLLLVAGSRDDDAIGWLPAGTAAVVRLPPLGDGAGRDVLTALLGADPALDPLKTLILRHTGGVPLFIEEVVRHLRRTDLLSRELGERERLELFASLEVPPTVQGVIAERIDHLPPAPKALLQAASILGTAVEMKLLSAVAGLDRADCSRHLDVLLAAGLLAPALPGTAHGAAFAHELIREVAYHSLLTAVREALHLRALGALEADGAPVQSLCHHAQGARDWPRVAAYALEAARRTYAGSALYDAARFYEIAVGALDRLPDSADRERQAIDVMLEARLALPSVGRAAVWMAYANDAFARAVRIGDAARQLACLVERASAVNFHEKPPVAIEYGLSAVAAADRSGSAYWMHRAAYSLGQAYMDAGRFTRAVEHLNHALRHLASASDSGRDPYVFLRNAINSNVMLAISHAYLGEMDRAFSAQHRAGELAGQADRPYGTIAALYGKGVVLMHMGELESARQCLALSRQMANKHAVRQFMPVVGCQLGRVQHLLGDAEGAKLTLGAAGKEAQRLAHGYPQLQCAAYAASARAALGDPEGALQDARQTAAACADRGYIALHIEALLAVAEIIVAHGVADRAALETALATATQHASEVGATLLVRRAESLSRRSRSMAQGRMRRLPG